MWHLSGFGIKVLTIVILNSIFILVGGFKVGIIFLDRYLFGISDTLFAEVIFLFHLECKGPDLGFLLHPLMSSGSCEGKLLFLGHESISVQVGGPRRFSLVLLPVGYC